MKSTHGDMHSFGPPGRRRLALRAVLGVLALSAASQQLVAAETPPPPAPAEFPADFSVPMDAELGGPLGGFGGAPGQQPSHVPVIFVHGNTGDACNWKLVRDDFRAAGWNDQALWALSYHGVGSNRGIAPARPDPRCPDEREAAGYDGTPRVTSNDVNVPDLAAFIRAVRDYTGVEAYTLAGHSLGVTLARKTLKVHPELREDLVAFVGIAGGNDGTSLCPPGSEKALPVCRELAPGSAWLAELNGPDGVDETYPPAQWLTVYDGSGEADIAFTGELADSPALEGADNRTFPGTTHNDLRVREDIVAVYREFLEAAQPEALTRDRLPRRLQHHLIGR